MIITYICVGIAGVLLWSTLYCHEKWQKCEQTLTEQTQNMLDARRKISSLYDEINRYGTHCTFGGACLKYSDKVLEALETVGFVAVHGGFEPNGKRPFIVKVFEYDPNDPEDRDFAIRQAEELIETIQNF